MEEGGEKADTRADGEEVMLIALIPRRTLYLPTTHTQHRMSVVSTFVEEAPIPVAQGGAVTVVSAAN